MRREFRVVVCFYVVVGLILSVPFSFSSEAFSVKREREEKREKIFSGGGKKERRKKAPETEENSTSYK